MSRTRVIKPVKFVPSMLVSTTAIDAEPTWAAGTYAEGDVVIQTTTISKGYMRGLPTLRRFESLIASNTTDPAAGTGEWLDLGPANTVAAFDNRISTQSSATGDLVMELAPGTVVTTVALLNVFGGTATLTAQDAEGEHYNKTIDLVEPNVGDWFEYFTAPIEQLSRAVFDNVPCYSDSTITITVSGTTTGVGHVVFGQSFDLGTSPQYGATSGIVDYSLKETDEFGVEELLERDFADENAITLLVEKPRLNSVKRLLRELRATPCLWIASEDPYHAEALITFGWYRSHTVALSYLNHSILDLEIEGLS